MKEQLLATVANSKNYTLSIAEQMPDDLYDFKPAGTVWSFREQLHHIAYGISWWENNYIKNIESAWAPNAATHSKQEIIQNLKDAYNSLVNTINAAKLTNDEIKGVHATLDHITHHRGQAVIYLRCNNITPADYTY